MWPNWHFSLVDIDFVAMKIIASGYASQSRMQLSVCCKQALVHLTTHKTQPR